MAELKTKPTDRKVEEFLNTVSDPARRADCFAILDLMHRITSEEPLMWGPSIIGFGTYHYIYASGREGDCPLTGFSPRKQNLTLYITTGFDKYDDLLAKLGKYKTGKSCLYVKRLSDIDLKVLSQLIKESVAATKKRYR